MNDKVERAASVVLTLCAVAFLALFARRELSSGQDLSRPERDNSPPSRVENWSELLSASLPLDSTEATVTLLEFTDLECPACKRFHRRLVAMEAQHPGKFKHVVVHFPLAMHRFARQAAQGLECAHAAGAARAFVDVTFSKQDSLGLKPWVEYAYESSIRDTAVFSKCIRNTAVASRVEASRLLGERSGVQGTPAIVLNGWRFHRLPTDDELLAAIDRLSKSDRLLDPS